MGQFHDHGSMSHGVIKQHPSLAKVVVPPLIFFFLDFFFYHVSRCAACGGQQVELVLVYDSRQSKVSNEQLAVFSCSLEQQVLGLYC